jgi:hypothetical protein
MRGLAIAALAIACGKPAKPRSTTTLVLEVTEAGKPVAARVLLFDAQNQPVHIGQIDLYGKRQGAAACAIAPGVLGSWDGLILAYGSGEVPIGVDTCVPSPAIKYGRYRVWAWRGVEFEKWEGDVDLSANRGRVQLAIALERAWTPHGTVAADLHVHAHASDDSRMPNPQRVIAQVAAGIQVVALTDHNASGDLDAEISELKLDDTIASIAGNELTGNALHVNVYPVPVNRNQPRGGSPPNDKVVPLAPTQMFELARSFTPRVTDRSGARDSAGPIAPIVQVNHPRFRVNSLYDGVGWNGVTWPPPFPLNFDAVEVLAGYSAFNVDGDRRLDDGVRDFYTLVDHGHLVTGLGNSDTHDLNWVLDGTARNYVFLDDTRIHPFDEPTFIGALRARRVVATTGPWLDVEAAPKQGATQTVGAGQSLSPDGGAIWLDITLSQTRWVKCDRIRITIGSATGPTLVQQIDVPANVREHRWAGRIEVGAQDTWIGVTADGDTAMPLEFTGTYQRDKWNRAGVTPMALISPILVDVDRDGRWKRGDADVVLGVR